MENYYIIAQVLVTLFMAFVLVSLIRNLVFIKEAFTLKKQSTFFHVSKKLTMHETIEINDKLDSFIKEKVKSFMIDFTILFLIYVF